MARTLSVFRTTINYYYTLTTSSSLNPHVDCVYGGNIHFGYGATPPRSQESTGRSRPCCRYSSSSGPKWQDLSSLYWSNHPGVSTLAACSTRRWVSLDLDDRNLPNNVSLFSAIPHELTQDDEYRGFFIPKGSLVFANAWSAEIMNWHPCAHF